MVALLPVLAPPVVRPATFPLRLSRDRRTLVDRAGRPFPILGRSAWFVLSLSEKDQDRFLDDSIARGFNTVEFHFTNHDRRGNHAPFDGGGNLPFRNRLDGQAWDGTLSYKQIELEAPDYKTPNPSYWDAAESFVSRCERRGIAVLAFPAYVGYDGGEQGWMQEVVANGTERMRAFGWSLGKRFARYGNIVWMAGGDLGRFSPAQRTALSELYGGIRATKGARSKHWSAEWDSGMIGTDQADFADLMTLNSVYTWTGSPAALGGRAYDHVPIMPAFLLEEPYDEEGADGNHVNPNAVQPVRRFQWWGWLTTIGGYVAGNGYVWPFRAPEWQRHLDTPGSRDLAILNRFVRSIRWWTLVPSSQNLVVEGLASREKDEFVATASSRSGDLLVAYFPPQHPATVTFDFGRAKRVGHLRWMDPTTGAEQPVVGFAPGSKAKLSPPGFNGAGERDWVLVGTESPNG